MKTEYGDRVNHVIELLKKHDWWWNYADDSRDHGRGHDMNQTIRRMLNEFDPEVAKILWNAHAPQEFRLSEWTKKWNEK